MECACVTVCYSVLHCVTTCYSVLQCVTVCYSVLQCASFYKQSILLQVWKFELLNIPFISNCLLTAKDKLILVM